MNDLPAPLVPAEADLTGYGFMPLFGDQLFGSDFNLDASDAEFRLALRMWWTAWKQVPAASLPADERKLCQLAGFHRDDLGKWRKVRDLVMRNFVLCSDGRYYHRVLAPHAIAAWEERKAAIARGKASGVARRLKSAGKGLETVSRPTAKQVLESNSETVSTPSRKNFETETNKGEGERQSVASAVVIDTSPRPRAAEAAQDQPPQPPGGERFAKFEAACKAVGATSDKSLIERWIREGVTLPQLEKALSESRAPFRKPAPEELPLSYVNQVLKDIVAADRKAREASERRVAKTREQVAEQREAAKHTAPKPANFPKLSRQPGQAPYREPHAPEPRDPSRWWTHPQGVQQAALEHGVHVVPGEDFDEFKARVFAAAGPGEWIDAAPSTLRDRVRHYQAMGVNP